MKQVQNKFKFKGQKEKLKFYIFNTILKENKLPKDVPYNVISYYIKPAIIAGIIQKKGYGVYEFTDKNKFKTSSNFNLRQVPPIYKDLKFEVVDKLGTMKKSKIIRQNGLIVSFFIRSVEKWENRKNILQNIEYKNIGINQSGISLNYKGYKINMYPKKIIIYQPKNKCILETTAQEGFNIAFYAMEEVFISFCTKFNISYLHAGTVKFSINRQHYGKINDKLSNYYASQGKNIQIKAKDNKVWLISDKSFLPSELETVNPESSIKDMDKVLMPFFNDLREYYIKTGETLILSDFLKILAMRANQDLMYAENIKNHLEAIQEIKIGVHDLSKGVHDLTKAVKELYDLKAGQNS